MIARASIPLALLAFLAPWGPAQAQLATIVVPPGQEVVVPPRGAPASVPQPPRLELQARTRRVRLPHPTPEASGMLDTGLSPVTAVLAILPLAAAAALATGLPGGGGGASGPARTR